MSETCTTYAEAQQAHQDGALQFFDGRDWQDVPADVGVFFGRNVEDYRRKPVARVLPEYIIQVENGTTGEVVTREVQTARAVAYTLWGIPLDRVRVFKHVPILSLDLRKIELQLEEELMNRAPK